MARIVTATNRYVLKRFAMKLGIVGVGAVAQSWMPWGFGRAFLALTVMSALIDIFARRLFSRASGVAHSWLVVREEFPSR